MSKIKCLAASILLAVTLPVSANFIDGNLLLSRIMGGEAEQLHALGYITGVADATINIYWCPQGSLSAEQVLNLTKAILISSPTKLKLSADVFVIAALMKALPCARKITVPESDSI